MRTGQKKILAVVGAGPKGIAVAIKAKVLAEFGFPVDRVILVEKNRVAANWSGDFGYTNGEMKLGTSPEKDVVFPVETDVGDEGLNDRIHKRLLQFSWVAYLIQTKRYSDWIDRGRPAPCHQLWAMYLQWVSAQLGPHGEIIKGEVTSIDLSADEKSWELAIDGLDSSVLRADRLMLTGPGKAKVDFCGEAGLPVGAYDLETFWEAVKKRQFSPTGKTAIIGAGENAASALLALASYAPDLRVDVISPKGFIATRSENFYENQVYSQPERNGWSQMEIPDRIDFIERTDLGVFSAHAMSILNDQRRHQVVPGRMKQLRETSTGLAVELEYGNKTTTRIYDQVLLATGFDQIATLHTTLSVRARVALEKAIGSKLDQKNLAARIDKDLSVAGMNPALHMPMLAGLMQGPGFGNLSCLGRLSDRIVLSSLNEANEYEFQHEEIAL